MDSGVASSSTVICLFLGFAPPHANGNSAQLSLRQSCRPRARAPRTCPHPEYIRCLAPARRSPAKRTRSSSMGPIGLVEALSTTASPDGGYEPPHGPDSAAAAAKAGAGATVPRKPATRKPKAKPDAALGQSGRRPHSEETKAKIASALMGRQQDATVRKKISETMKGRVPWNKGKKMSAETRAKMSKSRQGVAPWNKGAELARSHRRKISASMSGRNIPENTRLRMAFARRRPFDPLIAPGARASATPGHGDYPLVETEDIHEFVRLRQQLREFSDNFKKFQGRRPSMADIRKLASIDTIVKFERYVDMRNRLRGLTSDVVAGSVDPKDVPAPPPKSTAAKKTLSFQSVAEGEDTHHRSSGFLTVGETSAKDESADAGRQLSANDFRLIGTYRVLETRDIHRFVRLRREIRKWSDEFKQKNGRTPAMSDIEKNGGMFFYRKCVEYFNMKEQMIGLVTEVYGDSVDGLDRLEEMTTRGRAAIDVLKDQPLH